MILPDSRLRSYLRNKYFKYQKRLEKHVAAGRFDQLGRRKKHHLISQIRKLSRRLNELGMSRKVAVAGSVAAGLTVPNLSLGQTTDLFYKKSINSLPAPGIGSTKVKVEIANFDQDADNEVLLSTASGGRIYNGSQRDGYSTNASNLGALTGGFVVGDLDGDGDNDIIYRETGIVAEYFTALINNGNGGFSRGTQSVSFSNTINGAFHGTYGSISDIQLVDFDSDGDLDFLFTESGDVSIGYFTNDGSGVFSAKISTPDLADSEIRDFEAANIDGDGDIDLIITDYYQARPTMAPYNDGVLRVIENIRNGPGAPTFDGENKIVSSVYGDQELGNIRIADIDGDGDEDIFFSDINSAYDGSYNAFISLNQEAQGTPLDFSTQNVNGVSTASEIEDVEVGDFDGDGVDDLMISQASDTKVLTFDGTTLDGTGQSLKTDIGEVTLNFNDLTVGDLDDDGFEDVIGIEANTSAPYIYFDRAAPYMTGNFGALNFGGSLTVEENFSGKVGIFSSFKDSNNDPISASLAGADASFFTFDPASRMLSINQAFDWESDDRTFDLEIVLSDGSKTTSNQFQVKLLNKAEQGGNFNEEQLPFDGSSNNTVYFKPVDFDLDGDQDIVRVNNSIEENVESTVKFNFENKSFSFNGTGSLREVAFIDLDEDGDLDCVNIKYSIYSAINSDNQSFSTADSNGSSNPSDLVVGDIDADGIDDVGVLETSGPYAYFRRLEFVDGEFSYEQLVVLRDEGNSGIIAGYGNVSDIGVADFDGDGFDDLMVLTETGTNPGTDVLIRGGSNGIGSSATVLSSFGEDNGFNKLRFGDFDGDGDIDAAVQRYADLTTYNVEIDIQLNDGTGSFSRVQTIVTGGERDQTDFEVGDIDGDGFLDIVTSFEYDLSDTKRAITTWSNNGDGTFVAAQRLNDTKGTELELIDIDNDDDLDILLRRVEGGEELLVFENDNKAPTFISLSATTINEGTAIGTEIATITVTDENAKDQHMLTLVDGDGVNDAQNGYFDVDGDKLILTREVDFESISSLRIVLSAEDSQGNTYQQPLTLTVNDANQPPTAIELSATSINEGMTAGTVVATISASDPNGDPVSFSLASGDGTNDADNDSFIVDGDQLVIKEDTRFESKPSYSIYLSASDVDGSFEQAFVLTVNDINQAPTEITLSSTVLDENTPPGTEVATITVGDPNTSDTHDLALIDAGGASDDNNDFFIIRANTLILVRALDNTLNPSLNILIEADDGSERFSQAFTITVNNVLGIEDEASNELGLYPNPGTNEIRINLDNALRGRLDVQVTDLSGKLIYSRTEEKQTSQWSSTIDMTKVDPGVYVVKMKLGKREYVQRWIKE